MAKADDWLGVDVGWVFPAADSDGNIYEWTRANAPGVRFVKAGPVRITKADGTTYTRHAYGPGDAATVLARDVDANTRRVAQQIVTLARSTRRGIALEDWSTFSRRKTAWINVWRKIETTAVGRRIEVVQVSRAYTSLTCPDCGYCSRTNRPTRDRFICRRCETQGHSDVIAARNIAARAKGRFAIDRGQCETPTCEATVWRNGLCAFCYRWQRRLGRVPSPADLAARADTDDLGRYRAKMREQAQALRQGRENAEIRERMAESYRTHDAWGNPLPTLDESAVRT